MEISRLEVGKLSTNCYVVLNNGVAFVVDPGAEAEKVKITQTVNLSTLKDYCSHTDILTTQGQ